MKHREKKFKLKGGKDANDMLLRKLAVNFVEHGKMITTEKKGKALTSYIGKLVEKTKVRNEANKNFLLHHFNSVKIVNSLFDKVGPVVKDINGGHTVLKRLQQRYSDGAMMVQVTWARPVLMDEPKDISNDTSILPKIEKVEKANTKTVKPVTQTK